MADPLPTIKSIAVGSLNPVKVDAVRRSAVRVWPGVAVTAVAVPSGVGAMPLSDAECIAGARQRARAAREALDADLGAGLEGGVQENNGAMFLVGWVALDAADGRASLGGAARLPLPAAVAARIRAGAELGPVMDELIGDTDVKKKGGAVGVFTADLVSRRDAFATAVALALAPFVTPDYYR